MNLKRFLYIAPIFVIFGVGILFRSTDKAQANVQSCATSDYSGLFTGDFLAEYQGEQIVAPNYNYLTEAEADSKVLGVADMNERWIEIDLSEQKLRAWDGNDLYLETLVSTGLPHTPTPTGEFRIWIKLRATKMEGGEGRYYYYLPNVPYVMFFENENVPGWKGYGLHGTYWHSDFGTQRSHGCVNLPTNIAEKIYHFVGPPVPDGKSVAYSDEENQGTRIIIHE